MERKKADGHVWLYKIIYLLTTTFTLSIWFSEWFKISMPIPYLGWLHFYHALTAISFKCTLWNCLVGTAYTIVYCAHCYSYCQFNRWKRWQAAQISVCSTWVRGLPIIYQTESYTHIMISHKPHSAAHRHSCGRPAFQTGRCTAPLGWMRSCCLHSDTYLPLFSGCFHP